MARYYIKKVKDRWYGWDRLEQKPVTLDCSSRYYAGFELKRIINTLPQEYPKFYLRQKAKEDPKLPAIRPEKKCPICNNIFKIGVFKDYCSTKCKPKNKTKRYYKYNKRSKIKNNCITCGKEFEGKKGKKYCKNTCSSSYKAAKFVRKRLKTRKFKRLPSWETSENVFKYYQNKPKGYHVDHIIPINHELVSGLHCINNFQYLTPEENNKKSNVFDGTYDNVSWKRNDKNDKIE